MPIQQGKKKKKNPKEAALLMSLKKKAFGGAAEHHAVILCLDWSDGVVTIHPLTIAFLCLLKAHRSPPSEVSF